MPRMKAFIEPSLQHNCKKLFNRIVLPVFLSAQTGVRSHYAKVHPNSILIYGIVKGIKCQVDAPFSMPNEPPHEGHWFRTTVEL